MPLATSPLRYPGGKACLFPLVSRVVLANKLQHGHYAEPYAGGCGLALALLYGGYVSDIHINDLDKAIWGFWESVLNKTEEFVDVMYQTPITLDEWRRRREFQRNPEGLTPFELGFNAFFLNRTNRSGIIKNAGVIGGLAQDTRYKIDCRFSKDELARRIRRVGKYRDRIHLHNKDALKFLTHVENKLPSKTFLYIDPPYFNKGSSLYTSFYQSDDHGRVASRLLSLNLPWLITYDFCDEIRHLYASRRQYRVALNYSAQVKRIGAELIVASKGLIMPEELRATQVHRPQYRAA